MQLNAMDCNGRSSNHVERDLDVGDESHGERTDDEILDGNSLDDDNRIANKPQIAKSLNHSIRSNGGNMFFNDGVSPDQLNSNQSAEIDLRHQQFPPNHPLNTFGGFMGINGLHHISNLQHSDVLEKLKMQVRDMKVGLMDQDYMNAAFGAHVLPTTLNSSFSLPTSATPNAYGHNAPGMTALQQTPNNVPNGSAVCVNGTTTNGGGSSSSVGGVGAGAGAGGGSTPAGNGSGSTNTSGPRRFSFTSPTAPNTKEVNSASNSSTSSEASSSSQQNNGWSFEEQYKQVRQLYEINADPNRKVFLDDLFSFMQKRGSPINRLPIMAKSVLDLYELYNLVIARGGLVDVINKKLWQEIIKGLSLPSSITSAAFTLRTQYMKYLYPYECEKKNLSSPAELQAAIDGNRREGRRSSYGHYEALPNHMPMGQMSRPLPGSMQQMSPLALVTQAANNQQAQAAAVAAHRRLMGPTGFGQMPNLMDYLQLLQGKKDPNLIGGGCSNNALDPNQQRHSSQSPEIARDALNALKMSHVALWQMYNSNTSPPAVSGITDQQREALNLAESPANVIIKREHIGPASPVPSDDCQDQEHDLPPPMKRTGNPELLSPVPFPANFYLNPRNISAAAASLRHHSNRLRFPDAMSEAEADDDFGDGVTVSSAHDGIEPRQSNGHFDKSDDSAIENSPSTSSACGGVGGGGGGGMGSNEACGSNNRQISPVSTKINANKEHNETLNNNNNNDVNGMMPQSSLEMFKILSGLQFQVVHNGVNGNGERQLVVNMEINGTRYSGLLVETLNRFSKFETREICDSDKNDSIASNDTSCHDTTVGELKIDESVANKSMDEQEHTTSISTTTATDETTAIDPVNVSATACSSDESDYFLSFDENNPEQLTLTQ